MSDNKLKIRINIQQSKPLEATDGKEPTTHDTSDFDAQTILEKPPFDWQKITAAILLLAAIIGFTGYFLWLQNDGQKETVTEQSPQSGVVNGTAKPEHEPPPDKTVDTTTEPTHENTPDDQSVQPDYPTAGQDDEKLPGTIPIITPDSKPAIVAKPAVPKPELKPELKTAAQQSTTQQSDDVEITVQTAPETDDHDQVVRAQLTRAVKGREPVDEIDQVQLEPNSSRSIYFFVELHDLAGQQVIVNWYFKEQPVAKTKLRISGKNWRTYANKILNKRSVGSWRVVLTDETGEQLAERYFTVSNNP